MCIKFASGAFEINDDIISDSLTFMLHAYHNGDFEKFAFWYRQFNSVVKVESKCDCDEIYLSR